MNLDKLFHLKENHTDVKTEIMAGITTFMTMAYILAVNPNILSASGMDRGSVFTATALSAFIASCLMALLSNYPFVLAPGMGLNAYFTYTVVLGMGYTWQQAVISKVSIRHIKMCELTDDTEDPGDQNTPEDGLFDCIFTGFRSHHVCIPVCRYV